MENFVTTPSSSDVDVMIEKFRLELSNDLSNDNDDNTRRLTINSTVKPPDSNISNNIDSQISELESLIKKLQDEISDMSKNADRVVDYTPMLVDDSVDIHRDLSNETVIIDNEPEDTEALRNRMKKEDNRTDMFETEAFSHIFPLMIHDVILPLDNGFTISRTPMDGQSIDSEVDEGSFTIKQDLINIWNDLPIPEENLDGLICGLQAEITEKMETLKESCEEHDVKFEDA